MRYDEITEDMIRDWKAKYGFNSLRSCEVIVEEGTEGKEPIIANFVLRVPSRTVVDRVGELGAENKIGDSNKVFIANCVLGGDMDMLENDGAVYSKVLKEIGKLMAAKKSTVKKL